MATVDIRGEAEIRSLLIGLPDVLEKCVAKAQNKMAYEIWSAEKDQIRQDIDRPTPWTLGGIRYKKVGERTDANAPDIKGAAVYFADTYGEPGLQEDEYLGVQALGGKTAGPRSTEKSLRTAGLLPDGMVWVPAPQAKFDRYGNLPGPTLLSMVRELARSPNGRGPNWAIFGPKGRPIGILARVVSGGEDLWAPYILFVERRSYQKRFGFYDRATSEIEAKFTGYLQQYVDEAISGL